jgi:hypothetical protein
MYASSNGSSWHHLSSDSNGQLNIHSKTQDGAGNDITSTTDDDVVALDVAVKNVVNTNLRTSVGGLLTSTSVGTKNTLDVVAERLNTANGSLTSTLSGSGNSVNSLDVAVQNTPSVKATQYGSYGNVANNLASLLPSSSTAGINVADWSYFVGAYEDYNGATTGTISLEYSFDNITYYTLFNTQIFPSGSGTPRRANINKQDIPGVNWIRLRNGTSSTLISVTLTLLGGSVS